ncbi:hypothetical protein BJ322DRAFT_619707 [Thelephora terrestris]|uniref:Uncharacterized protein n=1 Tax=Thelephora terrestris TaxID=56493 RepID=A0A9P6HM42_9AGAM|nr:hypothetical protein BJ322DRAFT_619707 [Thelephora terrestris]
MRTPANSATPLLAPSPSGPGAVPLPPTSLFASHEPELRMHRNPRVASVTFLGETYWKSRASELVSLEVASQTPTITKRGFDHMYHKSHGYRLTGGSRYFGNASNLVRKSQCDTLPHAPTWLDSDAVPPPPIMFVSPGQREKHDSAIAIDICSDSAKNVLKAAPLIPLEEAQRREVSRRNCAANRAANRLSEKEVRVEREVSRLKREVAEIAWNKAQAKRGEEESITRTAKEGQEKVLEVVEGQMREAGPTLRGAVAAREDGLVVAPTNWIVPLISLDEARHTEKAKRDAKSTKCTVPLSSPSPSAAAPVDSLMVNAGGGNTAKLELISLEEAKKRDRTRRLEEDAIKSRGRMLAHAGTGLSHVSLIPLAEARNQEALRRNGSSQGRDKLKTLNSTCWSRKPNCLVPSSLAIERGSGDQHPLRKDASTPKEKARWLTMMSGAGNLWTESDAVSAYPYHSYTNGYYP